MSTPARPFRFGLEMKEPFPGCTWAESARQVEALGYDTLFVPDHFHSPWGPLVTMATVAAATTRLKVAPLVLACDFRHPAVLAKEMASLDVLSDGRLEVGLGAGYNPLDYRRSGIPMDPPGVRLERMMEYTAVLRALFAGGEANFEGRHFRIDALDGTPLPTSAGGPPVLIGGGGPRLLRFAAQKADIIGVNASTAAGRDDPATFRDGLPSSIDAKFALVREAAGARIDQLEFNAWLSWAAVTDSARTQAEGLASFAEVTVDDVLDSPLILLGTIDEVVEQLHRRRARWGYSYHCLPGSQAEQFAPVVQQLSGR
jgi:probable F420-dependent oxidoreductase